jgi:hypothetical protein
MLNERQWEDSCIIEDGIKEDCICVLVDDRIEAFRDVPIELYNLLWSSIILMISSNDVTFIDPILKIAFIDREIDERFS